MYYATEIIYFLKLRYYGMENFVMLRETWIISFKNYFKEKKKYKKKIKYKIYYS
jgi:hypothetical protein